jgi:hypothetical protein
MNEDNDLDLEKLLHDFKSLQPNEKQFLRWSKILTPKFSWKTLAAGLAAGIVIGIISVKAQQQLSSSPENFNYVEYHYQP